MLGALLTKDLQRLRVNWSSFVILLAMPLCITALVGTVFGPSARNGEMPRIKLAIVNEDEGIVSGMLTGIASGDQGSEFIDALNTDRAEAMRLINENRISAVIIFPDQFSNQFLAGKKPPPIKLIKNPAESYMPAITEELMRVVTELLDAVSKNLMSQVPEIVEVMEDTGAPDTVVLTRAVSSIGQRLERSEDYLFPPIIGLESSTQAKSEESTESGASTFNIFAFVMPGLAAMFLLFAAEGTTRDLLVERRTKTLDRYRTFTVQLTHFFFAKSLYSLFVVLVSAFFIMVGGGLIFEISWKSPLIMSLITISYAVFAVGFAYLMIAVIYREKLASILNTVIIMMMAFVGGAMIPSQNLPAPIRDTIAPWMPNHAFSESIKRLQFDSPGPHWASASLGLFACGAVMLGIAIFLYQRRLLRGDVE